MHPIMTRFLSTALLLFAVVRKNVAYNVPVTASSKPPQVASREKDRRAFLLGSSSTLTAAFFLCASPKVAHSAYGDSSRMELPNYIEYLIEKNAEGSRESLYTGADPEVLLKRLLVANNKLGEINKVAEEKKWSQVQGILTGPLGTLTETVNVIVKEKPELQAAGKKIKNDLIAINQASSKKDGNGCIAGAMQASQDLEAFVRLAF